MNQGLGLNFNPNFYMVRDSGHVPPGMDCLQLQLQPPQLRTQPFHYLINEQAKSLLALQELQNEVGALLEFRDLVMETFPNLRQKMSNSNSHNYCSNLPLPLSGSLNSRHWEPGIKVKRKIVNKADNENSLVRVRSNSHGSKIQSSQPKSSEAISGVQDSGFSTETNSSNKDHASSTATSVPLPVGQGDDPFLTRKDAGSQKDCRRSEFDRSDEEFSEDGMVLKVNEAEEELWNLLDVIHTKGTKLREEVETLQLRLIVDEIENQLRNKESEMRKVSRKFHRRCRSLDNVGESSAFSISPLETFDNVPLHTNFKLNEFSIEDNVFGKKRTRSIELEDVDDIRQERNMLLEKVAEMETENMASRIKTSELQNEISALISTKEELQEQLFEAVKQKTELNSRIHELHMKFVTGDKKLKSGKSEKVTSKDLTDFESSQSSSLNRSKSSDDARKIHSNVVDKKNSVDYENFTNRISLIKNLGALDKIVGDPKEIKKGFRLSESTKKKLAAILKERNYLELQRHLLVSIVQNQILSSQLEKSTKSRDDLYEQLDKYKKENDELSFQLEERNIELEGTRAQVRVLEKMQGRTPASEATAGSGGKKSGENFTFLENDHLRSKGFSESEITRARQIFLESQNKKVDKTEVVRVTNRTKNSSSQGPNDLNTSFDLEKSSNVIPILALPLPAMASHQSSGTESTHALEISSELEADMARLEKCESLKADKSPYRRRPSKIPLNIQKMSKSLKSVSSDGSLVKKSDCDLNKSLKKCSLENALQNSIVTRSSSQTPLSIKYNSVGRTGSQLSIASQKSHTSASTPTITGGRIDKRRSLTSSQKDENSLLSSGKNPSLKASANFSQARQRDTLTRKSQANDSWDGVGSGNGAPGSGVSGKRTLRSSFRESFRSSKISIDGNVSGSVPRRDGSLSAGRKDSLQLKHNRTNSAQPKANLNKSIIVTEAGDNTKLPEKGKDSIRNEKQKQNSFEHSLNSPTKESSSDVFMDSLNSPLKSSKPEPEMSVPTDVSNLPPQPFKLNPNNLFNVVRENFQRRLAEKFSRTLFSGGNKVSSSSVLVPAEKETICENQKVNYFDSIEGSIEFDKDKDEDDSFLLNSISLYWNESAEENEAMADLDSLELTLD